MEINRTLFDNIMSTVQDCVFWKDKERRFVGVNQAFLDFYGFEYNRRSRRMSEYILEMNHITKEFSGVLLCYLPHLLCS